MTHFRFTCFAAVSTDEQIDKASIPTQIKDSVDAGVRLGGEHVGTYIADGYSRTGYWDLSVARLDIPPLNDCLNDINKYDVLIVKNYDRFGSLTEMIFNYFADKRKQLYSVQQATEIYDPKTYDPRRNTSGVILAKVAGISQAYRISKLADNLAVGIPQRAKEGKYARKPPYGYTNTGTKKNYKIELDPLVKNILLHIKDMYMREGQSLRKCAEYANTMQPSGNWNWQRVKWIFCSPWYAGYTYVKRLEYIRPNSYRGSFHFMRNPELYEGQHEAVWDLDTYHQLFAEVERRGEHGRRRLSYPLSGLVVCGRCGENMRINSSKNNGYTYYRCYSCGLAIREEKVNEKFRNELQAKLLQQENAPRHIPAVIDNSKAIAKLEKELRKVQIAYRTTDGYTPDEFERDIKEIRAQIELLNDQQYQREKARREAEQATDGLQELRQLVDRFDNWMDVTPPGEVNATVSRSVKQIVVTGRQDVTVELL